MRQSEVLEAFKQQQHPDHALHVLFDLETGFEVVPAETFGHLQAGADSMNQLANKFIGVQFKFIIMA
jgi:hypothetical protein